MCKTTGIEKQRNMHYKDILQNTTSDFANNPSYLDVIEDLYIHNIIDYKLLTPSALHYMREGRLGSNYSSFYFRASIMNPYLVYSLNMHTGQSANCHFSVTLTYFSRSQATSKVESENLNPLLSQKLIQLWQNR